jgi:hypothetical protein
MIVADAAPVADAVEHAKDLDNRLGDIAISTSNALESAGSPSRTRSEPANPEADAGEPAAEASLTAPASTVYILRLSSNRQPTPRPLRPSPATATVLRLTFSGCIM